MTKNFWKAYEFVGNVDQFSCAHFVISIIPIPIQHDRREQYQQEKLHVPPFVKLHEVHSTVILLFFSSLDWFQDFILLEQEIEDALPKFQELVYALKYAPTIDIYSARFIDINAASHDDQPTKEASAARKRLLEAFAQYDALAKRIKELPCPNGSWSSQSRIQLAIAMRASLFLQRNMFPLQASFVPHFYWTWTEWLDY